MNHFEDWFAEHRDEIEKEFDDRAFAVWFESEYERMFCELDDNDFVVDEVQQKKFAIILFWFMKIAKETGGKIDHISVVPRMETGGVTATFPIVDLVGENVKEFCSALAEAHAITMDATDDGVCISVNVANVFRPKP